MKAQVCASFVLLLLSFVVVNSTSVRRDLNGWELVSEEEREKDFMRWVDGVGRKNHSLPLQAKGKRGEGVRRVIRVEKEGNGDFSTIQAAVNAVPKKNKRRIIIRVGPGVYREKVRIPESKSWISMEGAGSGLTQITWHDTAASIGSTAESASVAIESHHFIAKDITFLNSAPPPPQGSKDHQAVAVRISGDKAIFQNCSFKGKQDTLFDDRGRHYFLNCHIEGSVDFICGDGQSLYKNCVLHSVPKQYGSLTAQRRSRPSEKSGFSFVNCKVRGSGILYLGRAWGPYSRVVFSYTYMDDIIIPEGWHNWGDKKREKRVFYGEYKCSGPGSNTKKRVAWSHELTHTQAAPFQSLSFIDGESWIDIPELIKDGIGGHVSNDMKKAMNLESL